MTFEKCVRLYRFYEALSIYDLYFERLAVSTCSQPTPITVDDRPLTWVPLVFHCTTFEALAEIVASGVLLPSKSGCVSFTEMQIDELDRFRTRGRRVADVAIGFPRALLESRGLFQPAYVKNANAAVKKAMQAAPSGYVELDDDLGALHEVRVPAAIPLSDAVWLLSSSWNERTRAFDHPELQTLKRKYGIALSFWHRSHQEEMIRELVYRKVCRSGSQVDDVECRGMFYFEALAKGYENAKVRFPAGKPVTLRFPTFTVPPDWDGPYTKFQMAKFFYDLIREQHPGRLDEIFPNIEYGYPAS